MSLVPVPSQKKAARPAQPTPDDGSIDGRSQQIIAWQQRREDVDEGRASIQMGGHRAVRVRAPSPGRPPEPLPLTVPVRAQKRSERATSVLFSVWKRGPQLFSLTGAQEKKRNGMESCCCEQRWPIVFVPSPLFLLLPGGGRG